MQHATLGLADPWPLTCQKGGIRRTVISHHLRLQGKMKWLAEHSYKKCEHSRLRMSCCLHLGCSSADTASYRSASCLFKQARPSQTQARHQVRDAHPWPGPGVKSSQNNKGIHLCGVREKTCKTLQDLQMVRLDLFLGLPLCFCPSHHPRPCHAMPSTTSHPAHETP